MGILKFGAVLSAGVLIVNAASNMANDYWFKIDFKVDLIKEIEINSNLSDEKKMAATKAITG